MSLGGVKMMNNDEIGKLIELLDNIIEMSGSYGIAFNKVLDNKDGADWDSYLLNGYEPLENYINNLIEEKCKEAFKAGADAAKKGYV